MDKIDDEIQPLIDLHYCGEKTTLTNIFATNKHAQICNLWNQLNCYYHTSRISDMVYFAFFSAGFNRRPNEKQQVRATVSFFISIVISTTQLTNY